MNEFTGGKLVENPNATLLQNIIKQRHEQEQRIIRRNIQDTGQT